MCVERRGGFSWPGIVACKYLMPCRWWGGGFCFLFDWNVNQTLRSGVRLILPTYGLPQFDERLDSLSPHSFEVLVSAVKLKLGVAVSPRSGNSISMMAVSLSRYSRASLPVVSMLRRLI